MGPSDLAHVLRSLTGVRHADLLVGLDVADDAAVWRLDAERALVQTVDFFPPIVDDAYPFGAIAAASAVSDVYAMGGEPFLALAIAAFPDDLPKDILADIFRGGADKAAEAGVVIAGGHTVTDDEPRLVERQPVGHRQQVPPALAESGRVGPFALLPRLRH